MKLFTVLFSFLVLTSSFLLGEVGKNKCHCLNCECTEASHCGCFSEQGCPCHLEGNQEGKKCPCSHCPRDVK